MAIVWGSKRTRSGTQSWQQLGIELSRSGNVITAKTYGDSNGVNGTWTLTRTGSGGGSSSVTWNNGGGKTLLHTQTFTGVPGGTYTFSRSLPTWWTSPNPGTLTVSASISIPGSPPGVTGAPTVTRTLVDSSIAGDGRHSLAWTPLSGLSEQRVQRREASVAGGFGGWGDIATVKASAATYSDTGTRPNRQYQWRIVAVNNAGEKAGTGSAYVNTTPWVPLALKGSRQGDGSDILVVGDHRVISSASEYEWQDNPGGTGWVNVAGVTTTTPYPAYRLFSAVAAGVTHQYRCRARVMSGGANSMLVYSPWSLPMTPPVQPLAKPTPPTSLSPNGTARSTSVAFNLTYVHVPTDASPQTRRQWRRRINGGAWVESAVEVTSSQSIPLAAGQTLGSHEWQVRTWGLHADPSDWSASAVFSVIQSPVASITGPATIQGPSAVVTLGYAQAGGVAQDGWHVQVLIDGAVVADSGQRDGAANAFATGRVLPDGASVTLRGRVRASGVWSGWDSVTREVAYVPPAAPVLDASWLPTSGCVVLSAAPGAGGSVETVELEIERSTDDGATWTPVAATAGIVNALTNPGGETSDNGWTSNATLYPAEWDTSVKRTGARSRRLTRTASSPSGQAALVINAGSIGRVPIPVGADRIEASCWVMPQESPWLGRARIMVQYWDGTDYLTPLGTGEYVDAEGGEWTQVSVSAPIAEGASEFRLQVGLDARPGAGNAPTGFEVWFDDAQVLAPSLADPIETSDFEAPLSGPLAYRAVATSALPSTAETLTEVASPHEMGDHSGCGIWINAGPGFAASLRLEYAGPRQIHPGRVRHEKWYSGRARAVHRDSVQTPLTLAVSGELLPKGHDPADLSPRQVIDFWRLLGPYCYRDPDGLVLYVSPSGESYVPPEVGEPGSVSVTLTETERGTDAQLSALHAAYPGGVA